jgi:transcriptional regulator GlxA family with amidase domain
VGSLQDTMQMNNDELNNEIELLKQKLAEQLVTIDNLANRLMMIERKVRKLVK